MSSRLARRAVLVSFLWAVVTAWSCSAVDGANSPQFRAGAAAVDITPQQFPVSMLGSFADRKATSANDPLVARALVLDDGRTRIGLVICDNCVLPREITEEIRRRATTRTKIPADNLLVAATHTHSAPAVALLSEAIPVDPRYVEQLQTGAVDALVKAEKQLAPARAGSARTSVPEEVFCRRWFVKEALLRPGPLGTKDQVRMNPPAGSPDLIRPAGPTDPEVSVLSVETAAGKPLALLANYSLHYVGDVPPGTVSADYFGEFCRQVEQRLAGGDKTFVAILSNGTSGDVNNINFPAPRPRGPVLSRIRAVAARIADAALEGRKQIQHSEQVTLAAAMREIPLGVRKPSPAELEHARTVLAGKDGKPPNAMEAYYARCAQRFSQWPDTVPVKLQAFRIGGLVIYGMPCEVFASIGLELKQRSPMPAFTIDLANGYNGYLPPPEQHALGGYETWRAASSYLEVEASRKMVKTLLELAATVK